MINTLILSEEEQMQQEGETVLRPHFQSKLIDTRKLIYEYTWFNPNTPASRVNRYDYEKEDYREVRASRSFCFKRKSGYLSRYTCLDS